MKFVAILMAVWVIMLPVASALQISGLTSQPQSATSELISWQTDEESNSKLDFGMYPSLGGRIINLTDTTDHNIVLDSLQESTLYYYNASSCNATECVYMLSNFTTFSITNVNAEALNAMEAKISWNTSIPVDTKVVYGESTALDNELFDAELKTFHEVSLSNLTADTKYYYKLFGNNITDDTLRDFKTNRDSVATTIEFMSEIPDRTRNHSFYFLGKTEANSRVSLHINGLSVEEVITLSDGTTTSFINTDNSGMFEGTIQLRNNINNITVKVLDADAFLTYRSFVIYVDFDAPQFVVDLPNAITEDVYTVVGTVNENVTVTVYIDKLLLDAECTNAVGSCGTVVLPWCCLRDDSQYLSEEQCEASCNPPLEPDGVHVLAEGAFNFTIELHDEGYHNVTLVAEDLVGNLAIYEKEVKLDTTPPKLIITSLDVMNLDALGKVWETPEQNQVKRVVHFQAITIKGNVSELYTTIRITNLGNTSTIFYNATEGQYMNPDSGDFYEAGFQGDPADFFYDYDTEIELGAGTEFETELVLLPGQNFISFLVTDEAGNTNVMNNKAHIELIEFDGGSEFWRVGMHRTIPSYIVAGELKRAPWPFGIMFDINPTMLSPSRINTRSLRVNIMSSGNENYNNKLISFGARPTTIWDNRSNNIFVYAPMQINQWMGDIQDFPDPLTFELKVAIDYSYDGNTQPPEYVYLKDSVDVDFPLDYSKFLTPETVNSIIEFLNMSIDALDAAIEITEPVAQWTMIGCAAMTAYTFVKQAVSPDAQPNLRPTFAVCDRIGCPFVRPDCGDLDDGEALKYGGYVDAETGNPVSHEDCDNPDTPEDECEEQWKTGVLERTYSHISYIREDGKQVTIDHLGPGTDSQIRQCWDCSPAVGKYCIKVSVTDRGEGGLYSTTESSDYKCTDRDKEQFFTEIEASLGGRDDSAYDDYFGEGKDVAAELLKIKDSFSKILGGAGCYSKEHPFYDDTKCLINYASADKPIVHGASPLDDIILSTECMCFSGMLNHFENLRKVFTAAKSCLESAQIGEVDPGYCEKLMAMYTCDFIFFALKKILGLNADGSVIGNKKSNTQDPSKNFESASKILNKRYQGLLNNQFGFGSEQLVHKACQGAITQDWTGFMDTLRTSIESVPVAPQIMPLLAESRVMTYNPVTGKLAILYLINPGVWSGGQPIHFKIDLICDPDEPNNEYCNNYYVKTVREGIIPADGNLQETLRFTDMDAEHWYNRVMMTLDYDIGQQHVIKIVPHAKGAGVIHKGQIDSALCAASLGVQGPSIRCQVYGPESLQSLEFKSAQIVPSQVSYYYPENDIYLQLNIRKVNNFDDSSFLLVYWENEDDGKESISVNTADIIEDHVLIELAHIGKDVGGRYVFLDEALAAEDIKTIFYVDKHDAAYPQDPTVMISLFRAEIHEDIYLFAFPAVANVEGAILGYPISEVYFSHPTNNELKFEQCAGASCFVLKNDVLSNIIDKAYEEYKGTLPAGETAKPLQDFRRDFLGQIQKLHAKIDVGGPDKKATVYLTTSTSFKEDKTPKDPIISFPTGYSTALLGSQKITMPGKHELKLQLYKDLDGNNKYEITDQAINYENNEQIHLVGYEILPSPKDSCQDRPRVHVVWPRENTFCREDSGIKIKAVVWDDCNAVTVTWSAKTSKTGTPIGSGGTLTESGIYYTADISSTDLDRIGSDEEMTLIIKAEDGKHPTAYTEETVKKIKVSPSGADCSNV